MNIEQSVEGALSLLEQIRDYPDEVLQELDENEQANVMRELDVLAEQAATLQSDTDLLQLADAIYSLVESQAGLRSLLLPEGTDVAQQLAQRSVTLADYQATTAMDAYVQQWAPQIRNAVIEVGAQLEAALQKKTEAAHTSTQEQKP
jgi:hypothetical protein